MKSAERSESEKKRQICTFHVEDRLMGVDILDVKEVNTETEFTPIFHAPRAVKGYVNIRGQIHLILDLRIILGLEEKPMDETNRLVLFKHRVGENFGILVDRIGDALEVGEDLIEDRRKTDRGAPNAGERRTLDAAGGVCKLKQGLLIILNAGNLLKSIEIPA